MATETTEIRSRVVMRAQQVGAPLPPVEQHDPPLPCPRCTSTNTKFCYYNNYNFSQPRHFCKSCRRYWTHGGTLRDIPVGGGSRKTAKRSRTCPSSTVVVSSSLVGPTLEPPQAAAPSTTTQGGGTGGPVFVSVPSSGSGGGFTSLLSGGGPGGGGGLLALSGFGLGLGFDDVGYGLGRGVWAFPQYNDVGGGGVGSGGSESRSDTWQMESGGEVVGFVNVGVGGGADCFTALPELAISTSANGLK